MEQKGAKNTDFHPLRIVYNSTQNPLFTRLCGLLQKNRAIRSVLWYDNAICLFCAWCEGLWSRFGADLTKCGFSTTPARPFPAAFS